MVRSKHVSSRNIREDAGQCFKLRAIIDADVPVCSDNCKHWLTQNRRMPIMSYVHVRDETGRDSVVGITTRYGLDGPGIESRCRRDFPHLSRPALGPTQPLIQ